MSYKDKTSNVSQVELPVTRHSSLVTRFLLAFQFLTIIPLKRMHNVSEKDIGSSTVFFPIVGAAQGGMLTASAMVLTKVFPVELTNGLIVLLLVIITGGLHLDGLADTFDAIASRGNRDKKLAIMKDSSVGPFGVMAIVFAILLKYLSLNVLFHNSSLVTFYLSLFLLPVFSRWAMVPAIYHCKSARQDGLGRIFIEHTGIKEIITATGLVLLISFVALLITGRGSQLSAFGFQLLSGLLVLYVFCLAAVRFSNKTFGGMTGDTFGAVSEISEILFLLSAIIWSQKFI